MEDSNKFPQPPTNTILTSPLILGDALEKRIKTLCEIAKRNGASLSLREIIDLTSLKVREEELANAWNRSGLLSGRYKVESGQVVELGDDFDGEVEERETIERRVRAGWNLELARRFSSSFQTDKDLLLLSVSGSTSYRSVSSQDDLDFFCVTKNDSVWIFLLKALIRARLFRIREKGSRPPPLCFSYVIEEDYSRELFRKQKNDALFARDAIMAIVLKGEEFYGRLLKDNEWIDSYFPKMYRARVSELSDESCEQQESEVTFPHAHERPSRIRKITNRILQYTLGSYIRLKSYRLNRRFTKAGDEKRIFKARIDKGHCLFESNDYLELRKKYADLQATH